MTCEKHDLVQSGKSSLTSWPDIKLIPQTNWAEGANLWRKPIEAVLGSLSEESIVLGLCHQTNGWGEKGKKM